MCNFRMKVSSMQDMAFLTCKLLERGAQSEDCENVIL